ncbi:SprT family protein [Liquorilactobacillus oeni]|uniref:SprT-like domain-containing protein n=1 Tax=Liquorilactobacillus oeni DSM 19972 TaxID=1423777 RepID=A0A0R1MI06_9LACO|nr:SprT family protein [Liquorilactobacillus oeni]KRL04898.1 hypothetical protein FD46_GL002037 [Liquorilactobacillus oeni DSM 19972]
MTDEQLQRLVEKTSLQFFYRKFTHAAIFNKRLKTTGGRYLLKTHNIEINPQMADKYGQDILIGIIKHELCHYHLHLQHLGYQHRTRCFKELLLQVGGLRYAPAQDTCRLKYTYRCCDCGQQYFRRRRINTTRFVCGRCRGKLALYLKREPKVLASKTEI